LVCIGRFGAHLFDYSVQKQKSDKTQEIPKVYGGKKTAWQGHWAMSNKQ